MKDEREFRRIATSRNVRRLWRLLGVTLTGLGCSVVSNVEKVEDLSNGGTGDGDGSGGANNEATAAGGTDGANNEATAAGGTGGDIAGSGGANDDDDDGMGSGGVSGGDLPDSGCSLDPDTQTIVCICFTVATWGDLGTFGAVPGMHEQDAISAWLSEASTASATYYATKPVITAEFLGQYDVIILQDLRAWTPFTTAEIGLFNAWLNAGGGVIALGGYSADDAEMTNVNALLASTGMSYIPQSNTSGPNSHPCSHCYGSSSPQAGWTAHPIAANLTSVGASYGRAINPGDAEIVAQTSEGVLGAAKEIGHGRVFLFHDEWVTYRSQWTGAGLVDTCLYNDPNNTCNNRHPLYDYTCAQWWYNALMWASREPACFAIEDPTIVY